MAMKKMVKSMTKKVVGKGVNAKNKKNYAMLSKQADGNMMAAKSRSKVGIGKGKAFPGKHMKKAHKA